jgi:hypothetical protein
MSLRDEDAWTGELMAIVDQQPDSDEPVAEAVVVEDESESQHVVNGKLRPMVPPSKAEPVVQKPQPPSPFATVTDAEPPALITTPKVEPVLPDPEPVVVEAKSADDEAERSPLEVKRQRAWGLLADWPAGRELSAKNLADAIACSEPMASRFIEQYEAEHGSVFASQN